jgi:tetratricopeptide (TPR) repeat protein
VGVAALVAILAVAVGYFLSLRGRSEVRRPGEEIPEITRKLAKDLPAEAPWPRLVDVTAEAGLADFEAFRGSRTSQLPEDMGAGLAWGDYDGDGDDDLFAVSAGGSLDLPVEELVPSKLYENQGDGTFRPVEAFPDLRLRGMAAAWGDYDGDGRLDLAVSAYGRLLLLRNQGDGRFAPEEGLGEWDGYWAGVSWADFDGDRDLDLYVCGYVRYEEGDAQGRARSEQYGKAVPYTLNPASFEPEKNLLLRNDGEGRFTEVAELYGVSNPEGRSLSALWHDFDADGLLDLYVANDISDNALYLNRGETFEDVGLAAWVADYRGAMGLAAGDWNRDGDDDLFITHWVAQENALYDARRLAPPPGSGGGSGEPGRLAFTDLAVPLGLGQIALPRVGWGTEFLDLDGDGWLDLVVANGSTFETEEDPPRLEPQAPFIFWSQGGEHFHDLVPLSEDLAVPRVGRGLAVADYDRDGDLDVAILHLDGGLQLLRNDMQAGAWLEIDLVSRGGASGGRTGSGEGSTVTVRTAGGDLRRSVTGASYLSQSSRTLHFGLGGVEEVQEVEVRWLGGETQVFHGLEINRRWRLEEGGPEPQEVATVAASSSARPAPVSKDLDERQRLARFWELQRSGMDAIKRDQDCAKAQGFFRQALELNPGHEDSRYYLANCLAEGGEREEALRQLEELLARNPRSHRGLKQRGVLLSLGARTRQELEAARASLEEALEVNQEETGTLLLLGEIALLEGEPELAEQRFEWACHTNPKAVGGFFLRGYLAWKQGDESGARRLLERAREARGEDWKPEGTVAEGDVKVKTHREESPLAPYWRAWDGTADPKSAFLPLEAALAQGLAAS